MEEVKKVQTGEEVRVWIGSLGSYNAGRLVGEWVEVSDDPDELGEEVARIVAKGEGEEAFIADSENLPAFLEGETLNVEGLCEYVEEVEAADLDGIPRCVYREVCSDAGQIVDRDRVHLYGDGEVRDASDVALALADAVGGLAEMIGVPGCKSCGRSVELPSDAEVYFDWDKYGRDLLLDGFQIIEGYAVQVD
jgi:antirestriction protein